jgi:hypothetical protein
MSEKKRQKKDGERKDKQNKAMHEAVAERKEQPAEPQSERGNSDITEPGTGTTDNPRS